MILDIMFKGPISVVTGQHITLNLTDGATIKELANEIKIKFLVASQKIGLDAVITNLLEQNIILVNGVEISALNGEKTILESNSKIDILNFTHGG